MARHASISILALLALAGCNTIQPPPISTAAPGGPTTNQAAQVAAQAGSVTGVELNRMQNVEMGLMLAVLLAALLLLVGFIQWLQYKLQSKRIDAVYSKDGGHVGTRT